MQKVQHITEKELDILSYFYINRIGHVRSINNSVKMSEHTLLKYLNTLEKRNMIISRKEGNLKIYEINHENSLVKLFNSYFDIIKLDSVEYKRKKAIKMFINILKKHKLPFFAILFGSTAKGNYTTKSDIDIILVFDNSNKQTLTNIQEITRRILAETGLNIQPIIMKLTEFMKEKDNSENYALQDALATGYPIFGNQLYHEVIAQ